jgi:protein-tyrosine-phosphatase
MSSIFGTPRMPDHPPPHFTLDQQVALRASAARLARDFEGVFGDETIGRFLTSSYEEFAVGATVTEFLPLLAERLTRERLTALARIESLATDGRPVVMFLCAHNAGRSQMALGFFRHHAGDAAVAWSGGSEPAGSIDLAAVTAMSERGIDISNEYPKPWTAEVVRAADVVVTLGGDACPVIPGKRYQEWDVDDPAGRDLPDVRRIRDEIERLVRALVEELDLGNGPA